MKTYTMREFNTDRSRICREAEEEDVVLTKHGKAYLRLNKVATIFPEVATKNDEVATFEGESSYNSASPSKDDVLKDLRSQVEAIENREVATPEVRVYVDLETGNEYEMTYEQVVGKLGAKMSPGVWRNMRVL